MGSRDKDVLAGIHGSRTRYQRGAEIGSGIGRNVRLSRGWRSSDDFVKQRPRLRDFALPEEQFSFRDLEIRVGGIGQQALANCIISFVDLVLLQVAADHSRVGIP